MDLKNFLATLFLCFFTFAFLLSGISNDVRNITHLTVMASIFIGFILLTITSKKPLKSPPFLMPILVFTAILQTYLFFAKDKLHPFNYALLFTEGAALWFITYNLKSQFSKYLHYSLVIPGVIYALFYFLSFALNIDLLKLATLLFQSGQVPAHQQIGNLWAIIIVYLLANAKLGQYRLFDIVLYLIGAYFLLTSHSRSAVFSVFVVSAFVFTKKMYNKKIFYIALLGALMLILYIGMSRSTLFSRPYYIQSILGFIQHPLGVGMGNFNLISNEYYKSGGFFASFSDATHNIFLEALSGVGIFALPLFYWGYKIFIDIFIRSKSNNMGWLGVFLVLSVMFFIDLTYAIPGMFWLWFIALGMTQREDAKVFI